MVITPKEIRSQLDHILKGGKNYFLSLMRKHNNIRNIDKILDDKYYIYLSNYIELDNPYVYSVSEDYTIWNSKKYTIEELVEIIKEEFNFALEEAMLLNL